MYFVGFLSPDMARSMISHGHGYHRHFVDDFVDWMCIVRCIVLPKCMNPNFSHCTVYVIQLIHISCAHLST
jgi:hypothetical protein